MKSVVRTFGAPLSVITYPMRNDGEVDVCPVDAFAGQTFNINAFGHIKSDVSALMEAQSKSEQDLIAQRLVEAQGANPDLSGLTDSDIFKYSMSRYYQTPAEVERYGESLAKAQFAHDQRVSKEAAIKTAREAEEKRIKESFAKIQQAQADGKIDGNGNPVVKPVTSE